MIALPAQFRVCDVWLLGVLLGLQHLDRGPRVALAVPGGAVRRQLRHWGGHHERDVHFGVEDVEENGSLEAVSFCCKRSKRWSCQELSKDPTYSHLHKWSRDAVCWTSLGSLMTVEYVVGIWSWLMKWRIPNAEKNGKKYLMVIITIY